MRKKLVMVLLASALSTAAYAANETIMVAYEAVVTSTEGKGELDNSVKFVFGPNSAPAGASVISNVTVNKISKGKNRHDFNGACNTAVIEALKDLQQQARSQGANAVVNIVSNYHGVDNVSPVVAECHAGGTGGHLTLKASLVKLAN